MTKTNLLWSAAALVLPLALASVLVLHPARAKGEAAAVALQVQVDNFTFGPATLTVPVNSTVTWVNKDDLPHVIASNDGVFKSKALDTDDKYSYTFTKAGTYAYFCSIHPKMVGTIVVK
jgi:plastocyanin